MTESPLNRLVMNVAIDIVVVIFVGMMITIHAMFGILSWLYGSGKCHRLLIVFSRSYFWISAVMVESWLLGANRK